MAPRNNRVTNSLVALSSAAVKAVYSAGYARTKAAADRFTAESDERRPSPRADANGGRGAVPAAAVQHVADVLPTPVAAAPETPSKAQPIQASIDAPKGDAGSASKPASSGAPSGSTPVAKAGAKASAAADASALPAPAATTESATATHPASAPAPVVTPVAAPEPIAPVPAPAAQSQWKDGTYTGWGTSRHGDIQSFVIIEGGKIAQAGIAQCLTRYSCSWIAHLPPQVVSRQSPEVDWCPARPRVSTPSTTASSKP